MEADVVAASPALGESHYSQLGLLPGIGHADEQEVGLAALGLYRGRRPRRDERRIDDPNAIAWHAQGALDVVRRRLGDGQHQPAVP